MAGFQAPNDSKGQQKLFDTSICFFYITNSEAATPEQIVYIWPVTVLGGVIAATLLWWFHRLPYQATREEEISSARALQAQHPLAGGLQGNLE